MPPFARWQRYLHLAPETTWGVAPPSPTYLHVPISAYDVRVRPEAVQARLFTGTRQRRHAQIVRARLAGTLRAPLLGYHVNGKSIAQHLLEWGTSGTTSPMPDSYLVELFEADTDNKRHLGLVPASISLRGSADAGGIELLLALEGKEENGGVATPTLPSPLRPSPFLFKDVLFHFNGVPVGLASFEIRVDNQLRVHFNNSFWPSLISAGTRDVSFAFAVQKTDATFDAMRRSPPADGDAQLILKGSHDGTGPPGTTHSQITLGLGRIAFLDANETGTLDDLESQDVRYRLLKPVGTSNDLAITYQTVP